MSKVEQILAPWLELATEALSTTAADVDWSVAAALLRAQLHAPLAGTFTWHAAGGADVTGFPPPTGYDLADVAGRAPGLHPLARHYAEHRERTVLSIDDVPPVTGPDASDYLVELAEHGIEKHLWIPLPPVDGTRRVCGVCRAGDAYTDLELELATTLQRTLAGLQLHADVMAAWRAGHARVEALPRAYDTAEAIRLTAREVAVMSLCGEGFTTARIARRLGISPRTAEKHLENAYRKLGVQERVSAVRRAEAIGVLAPRGAPDGVAAAT
ncbi:helix-turn-helix transcriptional regulator [Nocardioides euryhalodurans]|uniref:HTH luxR-type domain-containing protein n=1 Tax=Nocardioides euryhalodurans TaxID=2518370 RepID=A0A4P7GL16_9ACTN|nr:LuxR C-terminal-related transcriptional regulator [Nocardioides euryhalodurans]QBR92720.1 hypothetical protein EXE57_10860 [Nocardioides euryhalodurans]